jgi:hypothetical protein
MKKVLALLLLVFSLVSIASAEMLSTANPLGQGNWAVLGAGIQDQNVSNNTSYNMTSYGGYVGYGVTSLLDGYLQYGVSSVGGLPKIDGPALAAMMGNPALAALPGSVQVARNISTIGLLAKYTILKESDGLPVSAAAGIGYRTLNYTNTDPTLNSFTAPTAIIAKETTMSGSQMMAGFGVSKLIIPFVPYGALVYRKTASEGNDVSSQIDMTVGTAIAWSMHGAVLIEYTNQSVTVANGGPTYSSAQMAAGVAYKI